MDPRQCGDVLKHLEKQNELMMETYRSMSHELHKLQVEEEMLMRKFYEIMSTHGKVKRIEYDSNVCGNGNAVNSSALVVATCNEEQ